MNPLRYWVIHSQRWAGGVRVAQKEVGSSIRLLARSYSTQPESKKEPLTPLTKHLKDHIKVVGPLSVAQYMRAALTHPLGGYYMKGDVFGKEGDFTTSPEISQMFGELLAIWFITQWQALGKPAKFQFVELGPGRGTLMADMLRTIAQFKPIHSAIHGVHLIEASPHNRQTQAKAITSQSLPSDAAEGDQLQLKRDDGISVDWHSHFESVPTGVPSFVVAHEFFDALPIFKFERTEKGWREIMVGLDETEDSSKNFQFIVAPGTSPAADVLLLEQDPRYKSHKIGDRVEISPESYAITNQIAKRLHAHGGAGLIIDYGKDEIPGDTLRGIRKHAFTDPLERPGESDLSADVDFTILKKACLNLVQPSGPITQSLFLQAMGIGARTNMLLQAADNEQRKDIAAAYERLVGPESMGTAYKFLALTPLGSDVPYPFQAGSGEKSV